MNTITIMKIEKVDNSTCEVINKIQLVNNNDEVFAMYIIYKISNINYIGNGMRKILIFIIFLSR